MKPLHPRAFPADLVAEQALEDTGDETYWLSTIRSGEPFLFEPRLTTRYLLTR